MSEDKDLLARISQLAGQINIHKSQPQSSSQHRPGPVRPSYNHTAPGPTIGSGTGSFKPARAAPYPRIDQRGRINTPHRHRTLVLNNSNKQEPNAGAHDDSPVDQVAQAPKNPTANVPVAPPSNWVSKRDRHMQLINSSVYDKESQSRNKAISETYRQKAFRAQQNEKAKINRHLASLNSGQASNGPSAASKPYTVYINGLGFTVMKGGSKLSRIRDTSDPTPKQAQIGGVTFHRSKNGNLYRSGIVSAQKQAAHMKKIPKACTSFNTTGHCLKGPRCRYTHDPTTVALCKEYLRKGTCSAGESCDLSHNATPERTPACVHFQRGKCSNPECRYTHARVNPSALVCRDFAILGYCGKGNSCTERHVHECPDYANTGACRNNKCRLPHIDKASQIRKRATNATGTVNSTESEDDLSSDEEDLDAIDSEDVDSEGLEEDMMDIADDNEPHALSQQRDFVQF